MSKTKIQINYQNNYNFFLNINHEKEKCIQILKTVMDFYLIRVFFTPIKICLIYCGQDLLRFKGIVHVACAKKDLTVHHNCLLLYSFSRSQK